MDEADMAAADSDANMHLISSLQNCNSSLICDVSVPVSRHLVDFLAQEFSAIKVI